MKVLVERIRELRVVKFGLFILVGLILVNCRPPNDLLVIRLGENDSATKNLEFKEVMEVTQLTEDVLKSAGHLLINSKVSELDFYERNAVERFLEAGGNLTFNCSDTIYNWGQLVPYFQAGRAGIRCDDFTGIFKNASLDYSEVVTPLKPTQDRMVRQVLVEPLREPMAIAITSKSLVYWIERKGTINMYHPGTGEWKEIDKLDVYTGEEDGLLGIVLDPEFEKNHWAYIFYSPPGDEPKQHVSRFVITPDGLDRSSEKLLLEIPTQRDECCHSAGDLEIDKWGNLYISTGDNTFSRSSDGFTPIDERSGRSAFDAQKSASNTNDLRGKILRIKPEKDGSYSIPDGNLFPKDGSEGLPEIYVMGARNPFTIAVNDKGWLYWGDVGPDGNVTSERGPSAHDEINCATEPGNYGWPYFNADNIPYSDYDFETGELGPNFDPNKPENVSVNNTGARFLPPAKPAMIYYTFAETAQFPGVGKGSRSTGVGEVYDYRQVIKHGYEFSPYYDDKLFVFDWARDWIMVVSQDESGHFQSIEPFLNNETLASPIDMAFGPDGALYVLEYGIGYFTDNHDSRLTRIDFVYGNRPPKAQMQISATNGAAPLKINLSASQSSDPDAGDNLQYNWYVNGPVKVNTTGLNVDIEVSEVGEYEVLLEVKDQEGLKSIDRKKVIVGNTEPVMEFKFEQNGTFYWPGRPINYHLVLRDEEDGELNEGIDPKEVTIGLVEYEGSDNRAPASLALLDGKDGLHPGLQLIQSSDCKSCHKLNEKSIGPSFYQVADKYDQDYISKEVLAKKIINGGSGVWGDGMMIGHPDFSMEAAKTIVDYIFSVNDPIRKEGIKIAESGKVSTKIGGQQKYRFEATYTDKGGPNGISPIKSSIERTLVPPVLQPEVAGSKIGFFVRGKIEGGDDRWLKMEAEKAFFTFENIDLTNIGKLKIDLKPRQSNGEFAVEMREKNPDGNIISSGAFDSSKLDYIILDSNARGTHDLCFVFTAKSSEYQLGINQIHFILTKEPNNEN